MSNRNYSAVQFDMEKNVVRLAAQVTFGPNGAASIVPLNSKGIASVNRETIAFTGVVAASSSVIGTVSSFNGLFTGMTITGSGSVFAANTTISSANANLTLSINTPTNAASSGSYTMFATGGRYRIQFGLAGLNRVDTYVKLLGVDVMWDESATSSAIGTATQVQVAPAVAHHFIVDNKISVKTVPATATTNSTDASIAIQFGNGIGTSFRALTPNSGDTCRLTFTLCNSSAI